MKRKKKRGDVVLGQPFWCCHFQRSSKIRTPGGLGAANCGNDEGKGLFSVFTVFSLSFLVFSKPCLDLLFDGFG